MPPMSDPIPASPTAHRRRAISRFALAFVLVQALLPLHYYLGGPATDERFAWRMFSSVAMSDCKATMYETVEVGEKAVERPVPEEAMDQWQALLDKSRPQVAYKLMQIGRTSCRGRG